VDYRSIEVEVWRYYRSCAITYRSRHPWRQTWSTYRYMISLRFFENGRRSTLCVAIWRLIHGSRLKTLRLDAAFEKFTPTIFVNKTVKSKVYKFTDYQGHERGSTIPRPVDEDQQDMNLRWKS